MKTMTELTVDDVIRMVRVILEDKNNPADWYINDTPENMAKIWKQPPTSVRMNSTPESTVARQTTRMPLTYPLGGAADKAERPSVPDMLIKPRAVKGTPIQPDGPNPAESPLDCHQ